jgi:hypothetical protein
MALQGKKESVSVYDPDRGAYREVEVEALKRQLLSFGLSEQEAEERIAALKAKAAEGGVR